MSNHPLNDHLLKKNMKLTSEQLEQFEVYYQLLKYWNQRVTLTTITKYQEVLIKHFYDAFTVSFFQNLSLIRTLVDLGDGTGCPSISLKILYPHLQVTIIESSEKRINFLNAVVKRLNLNEVNLHHSQKGVIAFDEQFSEHFDMSITRIPVHLSILSKVALPYVKIGGQFIAYKGNQIELEIEESQDTILYYGGYLKKVYCLELPQESGVRNLITIHKNKNSLT